MSRNRYCLSVLAANVLLSGALIGGVTPSVAGETVATVDGLVGPVPIGLTADVSAVPDLPLISILPPYQLTWQKHLLAFQMKFESELSPSKANVDPIQTGSINESR